MEDWVINGIHESTLMDPAQLTPSLQDIAMEYTSYCFIHPLMPWLEGVASPLMWVWSLILAGRGGQLPGAKGDGQCGGSDRHIL